MRKLDWDKNGQITFPDFQTAVTDDPLLLEACGPCLPSSRSVAAFFVDLHSKYPQSQSGRGRGLAARSTSNNKMKKQMLRRSTSFNLHHN